MKKEEHENPYLNARKAHNEFVGGILNPDSGHGSFAS